MGAVTGNHSSGGFGSSGLLNASTLIRIRQARRALKIRITPSELGPDFLTLFGSHKGPHICRNTWTPGAVRSNLKPFAANLLKPAIFRESRQYDRFLNSLGIYYRLFWWIGVDLWFIWSFTVSFIYRLSVRHLHSLST